MVGYIKPSDHVIPQRVLDRIWDRIAVAGEDECWLWKLSVSSNGYGQTGWSLGGGKRFAATSAHRAAWTATHGPIPAGMTVDHICRVRRCCNPRHLRLLTNVENARNNAQANRSHCPQGHPYDEANTYVRPNGKGRDCRTCRSVRDRRSL